MEKEKQMPAAAENATEIDPALCRPVGSKLDTDQIVRPSVSYWAGVWRRLKQDKLAIACAVLLLILILLAVFAPIFSPYRYDQTDLLSSNVAGLRAARGRTTSLTTAWGHIVARLRG